MEGTRTEGRSNKKTKKASKEKDPDKTRQQKSAINPNSTTKSRRISPAGSLADTTPTTLTFHEHPGEGGEEEEVEEASHHAAHHRLVRLVDPRQEDRLRDQQAHAQVLMDGRAIALRGRRSRQRAAGEHDH